MVADEICKFGLAFCPQLYQAHQQYSAGVLPVLSVKFIFYSSLTVFLPTISYTLTKY